MGNMLNRLLIFSSFFLLLVGGCKKKEIPGPQGPPGVNGTGGNANTANSDVFVINTSDWKVNGNVYEVIYSSSLLTSTVVNAGSVSVFTQLSGVWWELPTAHGDLLMQCGFSEGKVKITYADIHGGLPDPPPTANYRIVTVSTGAKKLPSQSAAEMNTSPEIILP